MEFPRQEYWSVSPFPVAGDLPDPAIEPSSPALAGEYVIGIPVAQVVKNLPAMQETWV